MRSVLSVKTLAATFNQEKGEGPSPGLLSMIVKLQSNIREGSFPALRPRVRYRAEGRIVTPTLHLVLR